MQIQRTGYQQNFGTIKVGLIQNRKMLRKLGDFDRFLRREGIKDLRCITVSPEKVIFLDDYHAKSINDGLIMLQPGRFDKLGEDNWVEAATNFSESENAQTVVIECDALDELLQKLPMLHGFKDVLISLFNPMKS